MSSDPHGLHVITDTEARGAQTFARDLVTAFDQEGVEARLVALARGRRGEGVAAPVLGPRRLAPATLLALRREAAAHECGVAVAHGSSTLPATAVALSATQVPVVYRQISDSMFWAASRLRRLRVRAYYSRVDHVVALWSGAADVLVTRFAVPRERIEVIPNGVPVPAAAPPTEASRRAARRSLGLDESRPTLLYIGALAPEKGVADLPRITAGCRDAQLLVVGDGPQAAEVRSRAASSGITAVFTGSVRDPSAAYAAADVVVLPSRGGDSMPAVLMEAGLRYLPCVTTDVAAISQVVLHEETGFVVRPGDVTALQTAVATLCREPELSAEMGTRARSHCRSNFAIDIIASEWRDLLQRVNAARAR